MNDYEKQTIKNTIRRMKKIEERNKLKEENELEEEKENFTKDNKEFLLELDDMEISYPYKYKCKGGWENGKFSGIAFEVYEDDSIYEGEFENNLRNGKGIIKRGVEYKYNGYWLNGKFHGKGFINIYNKSTYDGYFKNGEYHGSGTLTSFKNDTHNFTYIGHFENGQFHGEGFILIPNSNTKLYKCKYENGINIYMNPI